MLINTQVKSILDYKKDLILQIKKLKPSSNYTKELENITIEIKKFGELTKLEEKQVQPRFGIVENYHEYEPKTIRPVKRGSKWRVIAGYENHFHYEPHISRFKRTVQHAVNNTYFRSYAKIINNGKSIIHFLEDEERRIDAKNDFIFIIKDGYIHVKKYSFVIKYYFEKDFKNFDFLYHAHLKNKIKKNKVKCTIKNYSIGHKKARLLAEKHGFSLKINKSNKRDRYSAILVDKTNTKENYHLSNLTLIKNGIIALLDRRKEKRFKERSERILKMSRNIFVMPSDSIESGNCEPGTQDFKEKLDKMLNANGEYAVRGDFILSVRNDTYTQRAIIQAYFNREKEKGILKAI